MALTPLQQFKKLRKYLFGEPLAGFDIADPLGWVSLSIHLILPQNAHGDGEKPIAEQFAFVTRDAFGRVRVDCAVNLDLGELILRQVGPASLVVDLVRFAKSRMQELAKARSSETATSPKGEIPKSPDGDLADS